MVRFRHLRFSLADHRKTFFPSGRRDRLAVHRNGDFRRRLRDATGRRLVIGAYADRVGRKQALLLTILLMGLGTAIIGVALCRARPISRRS
jgi:MFS transporter, MHS family, proline/betaine transporter